MIFKVKSALSRAGINNKSSVAVAFSGGCDSCALLHTLSILKSEIGFHLCAIHVNHGIRGAEAASDAEFAISFCKSIGVQIDIRNCNVPLECQRTGESTELCARRIRYEIFDEYVAHGFTVATAHTASDNTETVLFNLTRGTGIKGMCGIPFVRDGYVRPILSCTRAETELYCNKCGIKYAIDSTNLTDDYTRNFIRHNVVPMLKKVNPSIDDAFMSMTDQLSTIDSYLDQMTEYAISDCRITGRTFNRKKLVELNKAILTRLIRHVVYELTDLYIDYDTTMRIFTVIIDCGKVQISDDYFVSATKNKVNFYSVSDCDSINMPLEICEFSNNFIKLNITSAHIVNKLLMQNTIDCDKIVGEAVIRNRISGECIKLPNRPTKQVRRLMNEYEIPAHLRDGLPLIADSDGVIFIPFIGVAERVLPNENSKNLIIVTAEGNDND